MREPVQAIFEVAPDWAYAHAAGVHTSAEVTLNGERIGVALRLPYRLRITEQARVGDNDLTVEVNNTLATTSASGSPRPPTLPGSSRAAA